LGRRHLLALGAGLLALIVAVFVLPGGSDKKAALPRPVPAPTPTEQAPVFTAPVSTIDLHRTLLQVPAGFTLFARGTGVVLSVDLTRGRMVATRIPVQDPTEPVSFLVGHDRAIVWEQDSRTGYVIPDGQAAIPSAGAAATAGPIFPGPDDQHFWSQTRSGTAMVLSDLTGRATGRPVPMPMYGVRSDGLGYLTFQKADGTYRAGPDGVHQITDGELIATGPTRWLTAECGAQQRCSTFVIDRRTGAKRLVSASPTYYGFGRISADGRLAAVYRSGSGGDRFSLHLLDLSTGRDQATNLTMLEPNAPPPSVLWSPDSHWLFSTVGGNLTVMDGTARVRKLGLNLPPISQLAARS
jgi:hypothetical protein